MLNSSILDVVLGLVFSFLAISLVASALVEAVSSILNLRAKGLMTGVGRLLNDPSMRGLALRLYQHTAVNPAGVLTAAALTGNPDAVDLSHPPAYIDPWQFASAFMDVTGLSVAAAQHTASAGQAIAAMAPALEALRAENPQLADLIGGIALRAGGQSEQIEAGIARWFDASMDRLGGPYKRRTQVGSFALALALSALLNVDAIRIGVVLWEQPSLADNLKLPPEAIQALAARTTPSPPAAPDAGSPVAADAAAADAVLAVLDRHLPVGWQADQLHLDRWQDWVQRILGWLIVAIASLFGAPFWFDVLQSVVRIKGSGPSPAEKSAKRAAAA